jgi:hypothetical protein
VWALAVYRTFSTVVVMVDSLAKRKRIEGIALAQFFVRCRRFLSGKGNTI